MRVTRINKPLNPIKRDLLMPIRNPIERVSFDIAKDELDLWSYGSEGVFVCITPKNPKSCVNYHVKEDAKTRF